MFFVNIIFVNLFVQAVFELPAVSGQQQTIVGGQDASLGTAPYAVSLKDVVTTLHFCGGSIISEKFVLSAAHCTIDKSKYLMLVIAGTVNLLIGGDTHTVCDIINHENYDKEFIVHDISLIKVCESFNLGSTVAIINLPDVDTGAGEVLFICGWGKTSESSLLPSLNLKCLYVYSITLEQCTEAYRDVNPVYPSELCTLNKAGEGVCNGDSGGGLNKNNTIVGIVSWSLGCAANKPDVYTKVHYYLDWITPKISNSEGSGLLGR